MRGFSFAEFLIYAAILGILMAIAIPQFLAFQEKRKNLPAEDPRPPEQQVADNFGVVHVGELDGCKLYRYNASNCGYHFFLSCPRTCPETKKP
jgi:hypothetical protein